VIGNWRLIGRFIHVFDAASFSSSYWVDVRVLVNWCWMFCGLFGGFWFTTIQQSATTLLVYLNERYDVHALT
jgi:hypothetical protein